MDWRNKRKRIIEKYLKKMKVVAASIPKKGTGTIGNGRKKSSTISFVVTVIAACSSTTNLLDVVDAGSSSSSHPTPNGMKKNPSNHSDVPFTPTSSRPKKKRSSSSSKRRHVKKKKDPEDKVPNTEPSTNNSSKSDTSTDDSPNSNNNDENIKNKVVDEISRLKDYYEILNIRSRTCTSIEITKAYRRRAVQTHPDKVGTRTAFDKVAEAYDTLKDEQKRSLYDRVGHDTYIQKQSSHDHYPSSSTGFPDFFSNFFSSTNPSYPQRNKHNRMPKNRPMRYQLEVTLEQIYSGATIQMQRRRADKSVKTHTISIRPGMRTGQSIRLSGEMDDNPNDTPADILFVLQTKPHSTFTQKGYDIAMEYTITLEEALCGFLNKPFLHTLSGKTLYISNNETNHKIIQNGQVHLLKGWGMPKPNQPGSYGDLFLQYKIQLPIQQQHQQQQQHPLTIQEQQQLSHLLRKLTTNDAVEENCYYSNQSPAFDTDAISVEVKETSPSHFGQISREERLMEEEEENDDHNLHDQDMFDEDQYHSQYPSSFFGNRGFQYFSSAGQNPFFQQRRQQYYNNSNNDEGNVQCQQM